MKRTVLSGPAKPVRAVRRLSNRRCRLALSSAADPAPACWRMCWSANTLIIFHYIARAKSMPVRG